MSKNLSSPEIAAKVYIVILNWNGWRDTIECLEAVLRSDYSNFQVIVCDNDSSDGSLEYIKRWAAGENGLVATSPHALRHLCSPPIPKPIQYLEVSASEAASCAADAPSGHAPLVLVRTGDNLGFAGGNNVGLRYALSRDDCCFAWLLNNDTVVEADALSRLVSRLRLDPKAGMCGSTLLYYSAPETVQALGGARYNKWTGLVKQLGEGGTHKGIPAHLPKEGCMTYVSGASMLVSKPFLVSIGLMCEDYFLYFEELDWALRSRGKFALAYAPASIVYHKEGASIGSGKAAKRSLVSEFYSFRNRLKVTRRYFPEAVVTVYMTALLQVMKRIICGDFAKAWLLITVLLGRERL